MVKKNAAKQPKKRQFHLKKQSSKSERKLETLKDSAASFATLIGHMIPSNSIKRLEWLTMETSMEPQRRETTNIYIDFNF